MTDEANAFAPPKAKNIPARPKRYSDRQQEGTGAGALICSLIGIFIPLLAIVGLFLGIQGIKGNKTHKGKAMAGLIISVIALLLNIVGMFIILNKGHH